MTPDTQTPKAAAAELARSGAGTASLAEDLKVNLHVRDGKVLLGFSRPVETALAPRDARRLADLIRKASYRA